MHFLAAFVPVKKILLALIITFFLAANATPTHAQTQSPNDDHARVQKTVFGLLSATSCILSGIDPINPKGCLIYNPQTQTYDYAQENNNEKIGGVLGFATSSMGQMYNIPVSTGSYVNYVASNFGITPRAYAQNDGFEQLNGILGVWTVFRNLAYLFFVLIFILIGMGVMLRLKIDPRTVMSIQNQIPRLIVGLVLITFSYAIAGFMVDLMWSTTYLTIRLAGQVKLPQPDNWTAPWQQNDDKTKIDQMKITESLYSSPIGFGNTVLGANEGGGLVGFAGSVTGTIGELTASLLTPLAASQNEECILNVGQWLNPSVEKSFQACVRGVMYGAIDWLTRMIAYLIVLLAVLIALFRIWWQLLKAFAYIVIYTCIAPIYIAGGLIPGSTIGFGAWIRGLIANLAVYPATVAFFLGAYIFLASFKATAFQPPLIGNPAATDGFGYIIAFAIIMVAPELINMLRDALKSPPNKYIAPAIQAGFGRGAALPGAVARYGWGRAWKFDPSGKAIGPLNTIFATTGEKWATGGTTRFKKGAGGVLRFFAGKT